MKRLLILVVAVAAVAATAWTLIPTRPHPTSPQTDDLDVLVAEVMRAAFIPGLAIGVIRDGRIDLLRGYGYASVEHGTPVSPDTLFNIASISKPIVGIAMLQLVDKGLLELDRDINDYLSFEVDNPWVEGERITVRNLATHTSGIADYYDPASFSADVDSATPLQTHLETLLTPTGARYDQGAWFLPARPGSNWVYSNLGAGLAGHLVETVAGQSLEAYCGDAIFRPLSMTRTRWLLKGLDRADIATPYEMQVCVLGARFCADHRSHIGRALTTRALAPLLGPVHARPYPHFGNPQYPDGGIRTSVRELAGLLVALLKQPGDQTGILSSTSHAELLRAQLPAQVQAGQRIFWQSDEYGRIGHVGSDLGVHTSAFFDPLRRDAVILLMNRSQDAHSDAAMKRLSDHLWNTVGPGFGNSGAREFSSHSPTSYRHAGESRYPEVDMKNRARAGFRLSPE